nr:MAG TPA: hypothetical protein [Caudoviricetes sp.]
MSRLALTTILSLIMLRINQWIIQENSDLLSDISKLAIARIDLI